MHRTYGLIRLVLFIAPLALLGVWGVSYIRVCWNAILAPGVPVTLQLKTPGGTLSFAASSYSLNPKSGFLVITKPLLRDPAGRTLASARLAEISGLDLIDFSRSALRVHLFGVQGTLERNRDGRFAIQGFLGHAATPAHPVPYDVAIDRADIRIDDRKGGAEWSRLVVARDVSVSGIGSRWLAAGDFSAELIGSGRVAASRIATGELAVHTLADNWQLADIGHHILATLSPEQARPFREITAADLKLTGPIDATIDPDVSPQVVFSGSAEARDVKVRDYRTSDVKFVGRVTASGAEGSLVATGPGAEAQLRGWADWRGAQLRSTATGFAKVASVNSLPADLRKLIPTGVSGTGITYTGALSFDRGTGIGAEGRYTALSGGYKEDELDRVAGDVRVSGSTVWTRVASATYRSAKVTGEFALNWKTKQMEGAVRGANLPVETLLQRFPDARASIKGSPTGALSGFALLSGPFLKPEVTFRVTGSGSYTESDLPRPVILDRAVVQGRFQDGELALDRVRARTPAGSIAAVGSVDVRGRRLNVSVDGRGLDIGDFTRSVTGLASISGQVAGSFDDPRFAGQIEGYDLTYQGTDIALTTANITASPKGIIASRLDVVVGSSQISGDLAIGLPSKSLSGSLGSKALQLGDLLGDPYAGLVAVQTSEIGGTLDDPQIAFSVSGKDLLAEELQISGLDAHGTLSGHRLVVDTLQAQTGQGAVSATGDYDLDADAGHALVSGTHLDLAAILPSVQKTNRTTLAGSIGGAASFSFAHRALTGVTGSGTLAGIKANGNELGAGVWNVAGDGHKLSGSAQVSSGTRFLALEHASLDLDAATVDSDLVVSNLTIQNLYQTTFPYWATGNEPSATRLALLDGEVKFIGRIDGRWVDPNVVISSFEADKLSYNGVPFGNLTATGKRVDGVWDIAALSLVDGPASASAHGTIDEAGETKLDGEVNNFDLGKLAIAFPGVPQVGGVVSSSFLASGPSGHPQIRATLDAESMALEGRRIDFGLNLDTITLGSAGIDASGAVTYEGFHGQLVAHVPFNYPFTVPDDAPISAKLTLIQRPLSDLSPYAQNLDPRRVDGAINGALALTGVRDALHLSGGINVRAATVGFRALDPASKPASPKFIAMGTELKDLVLSLGVQDGAVTADVSVKSSQAGSIDGQLTSRLVALDELLNQHDFADLDTWLASSLTGKVALNGVAVKEGNKLVTSSFALSGALTLDGSLASPSIGGNIAVSNLSTNVPGLTSQAGNGSSPLIDPKFNIGFSLQNPGRIGTNLASIDLTGSGHIGGTMSQLDANALLRVVRGDLRLPGGKVTLEPGGTVRPTYQVDASGISEAHVAIDLYGDSHVTAVRNGDIAERYDVHLDVRGDLLVPEQVAFTATSDPPDLTQDQILALLGRTDLLSALGSGTSNAQGERQLQAAALGYALPSLFDPITSRLASGLGLDYLSLEYNALDQTSILAAKNIGGGFSFQVRRQLSVPTPGFPLSYDYRLVYQLPTRSRIIRRFSLFLGRDELTPWKIGFQYGQRL